MSSRPGEFSLIEKYFAPLAGKGSFNLRDDAAEIILTPRFSQVITQDAIAQGVHFFPDDLPDMIARKAIRVNLSDLAAKGAKPKYISLALGLGNDWDEDWVASFAKGLAQDCEAFGIELTGGDTFKTGAGFVVSITAIGEVPDGKYVSRLGAAEGDALFVTGTIGDGALGLLARQGKLGCLSEEENRFLEERYLLPQPRMQLADLVCQYASASMDISDGLIGDLEKLCKASGVSADIQLQDIPLSAATKSTIQHESDLLETAITGGDDYEILFTVPQNKVAAFKNAICGFDFPVTHIGNINSGQGVKVFDSAGHVVEFEKTSYDHSGERD